MAWAALVLAGLLEVVWAIGLKYSQAFTRPVPTAVTVVAMVASISLLGLAMRTLPVGTAYASWTGIGAVGSVIFGILLLGEDASPARLLCVGSIVAGVIGLKLTG